MTPFEEYHYLAARLFGQESIPLPLPTWKDDYPHNLGLLSKAEEEKLAASVLNLTSGLTIEHWKTLTKYEHRLSYMRFAAEKLNEKEKPELLSWLSARMTIEPVVTYDELSRWHPKVVALVQESGELLPIANSKSITCDSCNDNHCELIQFVEEPIGSKLRAYIPCPESGRVWVSLERLKRWRINIGTPAGGPVDDHSCTTNLADRPLAERAQLALMAMLLLQAFDSDSRKTTEDIATKALGRGADANSLKPTMKELRILSLVERKEGRSGGFWLTSDGLARAQKLKTQNTKPNA